MNGPFFVGIFAPIRLLFADNSGLMRREGVSPPGRRAGRAASYVAAGLLQCKNFSLHFVRRTSR
jgi:hypothetical protein